MEPEHNADTAAPKSRTIGDRSRDGLLEIADTNWDDDGALRVTVRELIGTGSWIGGLPIPAMRRLARSAVPRPEQTRSSRVVRRWSYGGCDYVTFAVVQHNDGLEGT